MILFYQKPETLNKNVTESSRLLGISKENYIKLALQNPTLFCIKPETLHRKSKILSFYNTIKSENNDNDIKLSNCINKTETDMYNNILAYILRKECFSNFSVKQIKMNAFELLNSLQKTVEIELPQSEITETFIKYAKNFSIELTGKNIFNFAIKKV